MRGFLRQAGVNQGQESQCCFLQRFFLDSSADFKVIIGVHAVVDLQLLNPSVSLTTLANALFLYKHI